MILESFAHDLSKVVASTIAEPYHVHWISGQHTESGRPMRVSRKLDMHWNKRECLERAQALQRQALTFRPGRYKDNAGVIGANIQDCLKRIRLIIEQGFYETECEQIKPLIHKAFWL